LQIPYRFNLGTNLEQNFREIHFYITERREKLEKLEGLPFLDNGIMLNNNTQSLSLGLETSQ
jgi:hypothetical protein